MSNHNLTKYESVNYEYSFENLKKKIDKDKKAFDALKEQTRYLSMKEAMASDQLPGFIPQLFTPEIILVGQNEAVARNTFTVIPQSENYSFRYRFRSKSDGAQILGEEDEIKQTKSKREYIDAKFCKIAEWPYWSWEFIQDSPLDELQQDLALSTSKIIRRENQLMSHVLHAASQGDMATHWKNVITGSELEANEYNDLISEYKALMRTAYVRATTRLQDRMDPSQMRWLIPPQVFAILSTDTEIRAWSILGERPFQITGNYPAPFGIPIVIMESGFFDKSNTFQTSDDIFLIAPAQCAAIRERVSLRTEPFSELRNQTTGPQIWERIRPYVRSPHFMYRLTTAGQDLLNIQKTTENIRLGPSADGTPPLN